MNPQFWNQRFSEDEPVYGLQPNAFYASELAKLKPGKILFVAEGQGRNALHAANMGWEVTAFDYSEVARTQALESAAQARLSLDYRLMSYDALELPLDYFDAVVSVFAHMPPVLRPQVHAQLAQALAPGGQLILEGFHKDQLPLQSGGPKNEAMLFNEAELRADFSPWLPSLEVTQVRERLSEGSYHQGEAELIRVRGVR